MKEKKINEKRILTFKNKSQEEKQKSYDLGIETKHRNGTLNTSKSELRCKNLLETKFDINYQYKCEKYPYYCDFYIPQLDLYIECNFHWTHGEHIFDENNLDDIKIINNWKLKNTKYYDTAIYVWTELDPKKLQIAQQNNLNYLVFYSEKDFINWFYSL